MLRRRLLRSAPLVFPLEFCAAEPVAAVRPVDDGACAIVATTPLPSSPLSYEGVIRATT